MLTVAVTNMVVQINRRVNQFALCIFAFCMEKMTVFDPGILRGRGERHFYRVFGSAGGGSRGAEGTESDERGYLYTPVNDPQTWIPKPLHHFPHPERHILHFLGQEAKRRKRR